MIKSSERLFICGKTGSGKTFLAKMLQNNISRFIVLDGKGTLSNWGLEDWSDKTRKKLRDNLPVRARVAIDPMLDPTETWEEALQAVYNSGNCTVYLDEVYAVVPPQTKPSPYLWAIWTRGREFNIGGWASTQRPSYIPLFFLSEAEHYFCFRLMLEDDRKRMSGFMTAAVLDPIQDKHGFYYMAAEEDYPHYISKLENRHFKEKSTK